MNIVWFTWKDRSHPGAGGAEVVNEELAKRLARDGHHVTFIVAGFPNCHPQDQRDGFDVIRVGGRFTSYLAAWRYYQTHRAELKPDLVIDECNTMPYFAGWYAGVPTVLFFHMLCRQIWFYEFPQPLSLIGYLLEPLYLRLLRRAPVITVSDSTRRDLKRHGFRAADIHVIPEAIELAPVPDPAAIAKYPQPTLLAFGAGRAMKRILHQIQAFELARRERPDLKLIVAGDLSTPYGRRVQRYIAASPYAADITCPGFVSAEARLDLMRRSHVALFTSVKEGWCIVVTEAASQGTPAVVYDVDGLRDSVRHNQTGLITATNTPAALAGATLRLLADPALYRQLQTNGWQWSRELTFDHTYQAFRQALGL